MNDGALYIKTYCIFIPKPLLLFNQSADSTLHMGMTIQNPTYLIGSGSVAREKETWRQETRNQRGSRRSRVSDAADGSSSSSDHMTSKRQ